MSRHYLTFTRFAFQHDYYFSDPDKECGDLILKPTSDTAALMAKYRLLFGAVNKKKPGEYQLLREYIDETTPLLPLPADYQLRFEIYVTNPAFRNFTDFGTPAVIADSREIYFFENQSTASDDLMGADYRKMEVVWNAVQLTDLPAGVDVLVTPDDGSSPWTVTGYDENGVRKARIILENRPNGVYTLGWPAASPTIFKEVYRDGQLMGKGLFGILHLTVDTGTLEVNTAGYEHLFAVKAAKWQYFLMLKNVATPGDYSLTNGNPTGNGAFTFSEYIYGADDDIDDFIDQLTAINNGATIKAFLTSANIAYRDVARSSLRLMRTGFTDPVIGNLPNPPAGSANPAVLVAVEEPS
jgi:hypothetical protein